MGLIRAHDNRSESAQVASNNMTCVSYVRNNDSVAFHISSGCVCVCVFFYFLFFYLYFNKLTHPYGKVINHGVKFTLRPVSHSN